MKKLVWLMGSMASGKSTQRRKLCAELVEVNQPDVFDFEEDGHRLIFSSYEGIIGIPGKVTNSQCDGLDSGFGKMKKTGAWKAVEASVIIHPFTIVEGSQTASTWTEELVRISKEQKAEFFLIHFLLTDAKVVERLEIRNGEAVNEKKKRSALSKNQQFRNIFEKIKDHPEINTKQIDGHQNEQEIFEQIINFVFNGK